MSDRPADHLVPQFYEELRGMAHAYLQRERTGHTLGTTGLVHEAYLKLLGQGGLAGIDRNRFFTIAATTLRRILVDHARTRARLKRGGGAEQIPLDAELLTEREADELLSLNEALERLAGVNPRGSEIVQHRYFAGLTMDETAEVLGISSKTVQREWVAARAWLRKEIAAELGP